MADLVIERYTVGEPSGSPTEKGEPHEWKDWKNGENQSVYLALKKKMVKSVTSSPEEEFMFGLGMPELIIIMVIFLIIFGAGKLPEIGAGMGKAIKNFKGATSEIEHKYTENIEIKETS